MRFPFFLVLFGMISVAIHACGPKHNLSGLSIVDGKEVDAKIFPVVSLQKVDREGVLYSYCTGILLSRRHVLTAAHCSVKESQDGWAPLDTEEVYAVAYESRPELPEVKRLAMTRIDVHNDYNPKAMQRNDKGLIVPSQAGDIALWTLSQETPEGPLATPIPEEKVDRSLQDRSMITIIGFGKKSSWDSPWAEHTLAMAETTFFTTVEMSQSLWVYENGRKVKRHVIHKIPGRTPSEFFAGGQNLPDTCKGDSGGPAFVKDDNHHLLLIGITSRGAQGCDEGGIYTLVPFYQEWIKAKAI